MDTLIRVALATTALLCTRTDARVAAAEVLRAAGPRQEAAVRDPWFGDDKYRHFAMSFAAATLGFAAARSAGMDDAALPAALAVAAAAGVGKELYDRQQGGFFSPRDLAWDALGMLAGYAFLRQVD